jgi:hypothetical protein
MEEDMREEGVYDKDPATAFRQKKAEMVFEKGNTINMARAKEGMKDARLGVAREVGSFFSSLKEGLTPEFVNRMQYKKKYPAKIAASEE